MDIEFKAVRAIESGPIKRFIADNAIKLADWLYIKYYDYAEVYVMEYSLDEEDEDE